MVESTNVLARQQRVRADSTLFFPLAATILLAIVFIAFSRTFYLRALFQPTDLSVTLGQQSLPLHLIVHGSVLTVWFSIFCAQSWLGVMRRIKVHRLLGYFGIAVALAVTLSGLSTTVWFVARAAAAGRPEETVAGIVVGNFLFQVFFVSFIAFAVIFRRRPYIHKRLMFFAAVAIFGPATAGGNRPFGAFMGQLLPSGMESGLFLLCVIAATLALVIRDYLSDNRVRGLSFVPGVALAATEIVSLNAGSTAWGQSFAHWVS